jgi:preprotein translocase subunit SecG
MISFLIKALMILVGAFLVLLVLVQRGRGGGLAGALGGMGGQSAFGTKAGDLFTRVTIVTAAIWILLCAASVKYYKPDLAESKPFGESKVPAAQGAPGANPPAGQPAATQPAGGASPAGGADPAGGPAPAGGAGAPVAPAVPAPSGAGS